MRGGGDTLPPLVPPLRFSLVEEGIYRGAYPSLINFRFLKRLHLRSVVSLLPEEPAQDLLDWCEANRVQCHHRRVAVFKDEVMITHQRAAELLQACTPAPTQQLTSPMCNRSVDGRLDDAVSRLGSSQTDARTLRRLCADSPAPPPQLIVSADRQPVYIHCLDGVQVQHHSQPPLAAITRSHHSQPPLTVHHYSQPSPAAINCSHHLRPPSLAAATRSHHPQPPLIVGQPRPLRPSLHVERPRRSPFVPSRQDRWRGLSLGCARHESQRVGRE